MKPGLEPGMLAIAAVKSANVSVEIPEAADPPGAFGGGASGGWDGYAQAL
jgi:hypothetical protein